MFGLANIDAHWLFAIDVLAAIDRGFQVLHVEKRRSGDLDEIDILARGELFKGMRTVKHELLIDRRATQVGIDLVEMILAGGELIGEEIGQRHHLRRSVLRKRSGHRGAAASAAEQPVPHGGVGLVAERGVGLDEKHPATTCDPD